jgi:outer membrane receptor protein involved in Fe transport
MADGALALRTPLGPRLAASVTAVTTRLEYRDLPPAYASAIDRAAASHTNAAHLRVRYDDGATTADASLRDAGDAQDEGRPNYAFARSYRERSLGATHRFGAVLATASVFGRDTAVENDADLYPAKPGALRYVQLVPTHEGGFAAGATGATGPLELRANFDERDVAGASAQSGPGGVPQALGLGRETARGLALQATLRRGRYELLAGVRADRLRYDDLTLGTLAAGGRDAGALSPRAALRYDLSPAIALRASAGGGFRGPYLNELVRGFNIGAQVQAPNPNLVPERSRTASLGIDALVPGGRLALDAIETRVDDAIGFVTLSPALAMRENLSRTRTDGATLTYARELGACARLRLAGTTQRARVVAGPPGTAGAPLAFVPAGDLQAGLDAGRGALSYGIDGTYVGQTYADNLGRQPLGAALLFAATVRATTASGTSFALSGDNLTRQTYLTSVDRYGPPQTVSLRVEVPLGPARPAPAACS